MVTSSFVPPSNIIKSNFLTKLYDLKLNVFKLENFEKTLYFDEEYITENSFDVIKSGKECLLIVTNTIEEYNQYDKLFLVESKREYLIKLLKSKNIEIINPKIILAHVNFKNHVVTYKICHITLTPASEFEYKNIPPDMQLLPIFDFEKDWDYRFDNTHVIITNYKIDDKLQFEWNFKNFLAMLALSTDEPKQCNIKCQTTSGPTIFTFYIKPYSKESFKIIGWEKQKVCDISSFLGHSVLVSQANSLNLKLMKWKMWENLDLELISKKKCLLFGAGTLGCNVSRLLLGWGFLNLTFVDNGKVSYSNPIRQSLYSANDCSKVSSKAVLSAEKIKQINPCALSEGHNVTILCPDHPIIDNMQSVEDYELLIKLINEHDIIFTLTDDRESRWFPTIVTRNLPNKLIINIALGFDTYVISKIDTSNDATGCYFCNDIMSVYNTQIGRTEDQKCTITRPGISSIASGIAVEIVIDHIHGKNMEIEQIRGNVCDYEIKCMKSHKSEFCVACSEKVQNAYLTFGYEFVLNVCNNQKYLEQISGISDFIKKMEVYNESVEFIE